jgi:predicted Rossmann-fold nucleotide-binding protein
MSRNHLIVLSAHAVVALPGGEGTRSEIELALEYHTPLLLFAPKGEWAAYEGRAASAANLDEAFAWIKAAGQARCR